MSCVDALSVTSMTALVLLVLAASAFVISVNANDV
jgi:hypothetical protein